MPLAISFYELIEACEELQFIPIFCIVNFSSIFHIGIHGPKHL